MPTDDLTPAAEAFCRHYLDSRFPPEARADLAALLAEVRGEERARLTTRLRQAANDIAGVDDYVHVGVRLALKELEKEK